MFTTILTILKSGRLWLGIGGYLIAAFVVLGYLNLRDDLAAQREACNRAVERSAREAERITRETAEAAFEARLAQKDAQLASERNARQIADRARQAAESRPERVRTVIRELKGDANACLETIVPVQLVDGLRS
jgi:flagellar biosynthesis/type III secretory pathway M-ring protein FliF/YscJ